MPAFFVTGTDTEIGKTTIAAGLLHAARSAGLSTAAAKPVASGCEPTAQGLRNGDALVLLGQCSLALAYEQVNPLAFAPAIAPHLAAREAGVELSAARLHEAVREVLALQADFTLVEGAGGWRVPLLGRENLSDLARLLALWVRDILFSRRKQAFLARLQELFKAYDQLSQAELGYQVAWLCHRLGRISWLLAFHEAMEQLPKQSGSCQLAAQVLALLEKNYRHASFHARTCYAALLAEYRVLSFYPNDRLISFLFRLLEEQNDLCSAEYALQALYAAGDPELVLRALSALDRPEGLAIHRKVLVEGLQHFQPREALIRQLWYGFRCSDTMQAALVDFIRFASPYWRPEVLELLESTNDLDVKIACLRYFGKYPCTDVLPLLRRFSQPDNPWELQAVTMYVLGAYPAANALGLLKAGLHSPFWHVRRNAAASLVRTAGDDVLRSALEQENDPYAGQILRYYLEREKTSTQEVTNG